MPVHRFADRCVAAFAFVLTLISLAASASGQVGMGRTFPEAMMRANEAARQQAEWTRLYAELDEAKRVINEREARLKQVREVYWKSVESTGEADDGIASQYYALLALRDDYHVEKTWARGAFSDMGWAGRLSWSIGMSGIDADLPAFSAQAHERWALSTLHPRRIMLGNVDDHDPADEAERYAHYLERRLLAEYLWEYEGSPMRSEDPALFLPAYLIGTGICTTADEAEALYEQRAELFGADAVNDAVRAVRADFDYRIPAIKHDDVHLRFLHTLDRRLAEGMRERLPAYFVMRSHGLTDWDVAMTIHQNRIDRWGEATIGEGVRLALAGYDTVGSPYFRAFDGPSYVFDENAGRAGRTFWSDPMPRVIANAAAEGVYDPAQRFDWIKYAEVDEVARMPRRTDVFDLAMGIVRERGARSIIEAAKSKNPLADLEPALASLLDEEILAAAIVAEDYVPMRPNTGMEHSYDLATRTDRGLRCAPYHPVSWLQIFARIAGDAETYFASVTGSELKRGVHSTPEQLREALRTYPEWRERLTDNEIQRAFDGVVRYVNHTSYGTPFLDGSTLASSFSIRKHASKHLEIGAPLLVNTEAGTEAQALVTDALTDDGVRSRFLNEFGRGLFSVSRRPIAYAGTANTQQRMNPVLEPLKERGLEAFDTMRERWRAYVAFDRASDREAALEARAEMLAVLKELDDYVSSDEARELGYKYDVLRQYRPELQADTWGAYYEFIR